jgi:glycosyltransferase 2 family protein
VIEYIKNKISFSAIKKILNWVGVFLGVLGVGFVINRLMVYSQQFNINSINQFQLCCLIVLVVIYALANLLLVRAWQQVMHHLGVEINFKTATVIYGKSLLAKYVPGNVFQFASRQAIGASMGLPNKPLALSFVWELGILATNGVTFIFLCIPFINKEVPLWICFVLFIFAVVLLLWFIKRFMGLPVTYAAAFYFIFLCIGSCVFFAVLFIITAPSQTYQFPASFSICGVYIVAWLVGLITPGAPAGVGVREMVLYFFLQPLMQPSSLIVVIVISRIITILGEIVFSSGTYLLEYFW